jgi:hypothetical protein
MDAAADQGAVTPASAPATTRVRADGVAFELATLADDAEIRRLLRENPMPAEVSISLEREPHASIAAAVEGDVHHTIVARDPADPSRLVGMGSVSVRERFFNDRPERIGYLGQLRLDQRYRARPSLVVRGYRLLRQLHETLGVRLYLTSIAANNRVATRLLERGLPGMPVYRPLDTFVTSLIESGSGRQRPIRGLHTRPTGLNDLPQILDCLSRSGRRHQFAPVWTEAELEPRMRDEEIEFLVAYRGHDQSRVIGCIARWDQSAYKQAVVRGYSPRVARWRPWVNFASGFTGAPYVPPVGTKLNFESLSHVAVDGDDAEVFARLLDAACSPGDRWSENLGHGHFVLGLSERHPLLAAVPRCFPRHSYRTKLYAVHWPDDPASRAAADALDASRICQPEVALL